MRSPPSSSGRALDYDQSKAAFKAARRKVGLTPPKRRHGAVDRLTLEEELRFLDAAYARGGRTGLMMQTLLAVLC